MIGLKRKLCWLLALSLAVIPKLHAQEAPTLSTGAASRAAGYEPVIIRHKLGTTVINSLPRRVVALDMNEVDFLDQLGVPIAGMPKDFIPHFLSEYKNDATVVDTGAIVRPNLEKVYAAKPDLILITSLQANHYAELSEIAPVIHFDVDYRDSEVKHIAVIKQHLRDLGSIFQKQTLAQQKIDALDAQVERVRRITRNRSEKALVVLHNNGAFSSFGTQSRYGFVFNALGVQPASKMKETGLHGQPISSEFIQQANPDIMYVVDRTAVMENRPILNRQRLDNPLLRQTNAWKNGRVIFADAQAWYLTAASVHSVKLVMEDILKGYEN